MKNMFNNFLQSLIKKPSIPAPDEYVRERLLAAIKKRSVELNQDQDSTHDTSFETWISAADEIMAAQQAQAAYQRKLMIIGLTIVVISMLLFASLLVYQLNHQMQSKQQAVIDLQNDLKQTQLQFTKC